MNSASNITGIIHGKIIELASDPGLQEGQEVEVTLRPAPVPNSWGEGIRRSAGALAESWQSEDDEILGRIQEERLRSSGRASLS